MERGPDPPDRLGQGVPEPPGQPPAGPQAPLPGPQAPAPGPEGPPGHAGAPTYGGPVPPGGWQQPIARPQGWVGMPLASWGSRVGAALLDWLIILVPIAVLIAIVVGVALGSDVAGIVVGIAGVLAYLIAVLFYAPALMARGGARNGQTWGKQIVGIRVVRDNGVPVELGFGFLREFVVKGLLFGTVGGFFFYIPTLLDWLWPLWDDQNRCLHDMVVSTHVVRT